MTPTHDHIRNFCIIAHIDHGKSTLADRLMEATGALSERDKKAQFLDKMDIERERGITIKAQTVRLRYKSSSGDEYELNLVDTPGHVDFHYEVSRSLAACDGALLVVDSTQGIQAQTLANALMAMDHNLDMIPVINKIDLPNADVEKVKAQIEEVLGIDASQAISVSAKTGQGIDEVLEAIVTYLPPPKGEVVAPLRALVFDSWFDPYQGVVALIRVKEGELSVGQRVYLMATGTEYEVLKLTVHTPHPVDIQSLKTGEIGILVAGIKDIRDIKVGDTVTLADNPAVAPLPGFKETKPMVFAGIFPSDTAQYEVLKASLEKLRINDASFTYEPESSVALGFGFRCGFLGSLHMEIIQERLEREYGLALISTAPTVQYEVTMDDGSTHSIANPAEFPDEGKVAEVREPFALVTVYTPQDCVGGIITLCVERRGVQQHMEYFGTDRVQLKYLLPLSELIFDFHDELKSISRGYASIDYEYHGYQSQKLVKLNIFINGDMVDALSVIVHRDNAYYRGRDVVAKLRETIPRQMFEVALQAAIGNKIIARETVKAMRKDVISKCYGGDISRKRKLLEKQKEGKKRMKRLGKVDVPQEAFLSILKVK